MATTSLMVRCKSKLGTGSKRTGSIHNMGDKSTEREATYCEPKRGAESIK